MKADLFTKMVLTVIAVCLCVLAVRSLKADRVEAVREAIRVDLYSVGGRPVSWYDVKELSPARRMSEQKGAK